MGRISVDEATMVADMSLNLCRVGLSLVPVELAPSFTGNAASLLYVLLTGPYSTQASLFMAICDRYIRLMELLHPGDPNATSLWQCFLKILAKNGTLGDETRIELLVLMLAHSALIAGNPAQGGLLPKWIQYVRAMLKMCKYVLKRKPLPGGSLQCILDLVESAAGRELATDLLVLSIDQAPEGFNWKAYRHLAKDAGAEFASGSIGATLLAGSSAEDRFQGLFTRTDAGVTARFWTEQRPPAQSQVSTVLFWVDLCFSSGWVVSSEQKWSAAVRVLMAQIFKYGGAEGGASCVFPLLSCVLRRLLMRGAPKLELERRPPLERLIIAAHLSGKALSAHSKTIFAEATSLLRLMTAGNTQLDDALLYWPLAAAVNVCAEAPQPGTCNELREIAGQILETLPHASPRVGVLCARALRVSAKYRDPASLVSLQELMDRLPPGGALWLVSALPFIPNWSLDQNGWASVIEQMLLACAPPPQPPIGPAVLRTCAPSPQPLISPPVLRACELFLRFSPDVSVFEQPALSHLQGALVAFIQREALDIPRRDELVKAAEASLRRPFWQRGVHGRNIRIPTVSTAAVDTGPIEALLSQLDLSLASLRDGPSGHQEILGRLQSIISKYT